MYKHILQDYHSYSLVQAHSTVQSDKEAHENAFLGFQYDLRIGYGQQF